MNVCWECLLGMYGDLHCDCESQRLESIAKIKDEGGIFIHLPQEAQGWGDYIINFKN